MKTYKNKSIKQIRWYKVLSDRIKQAINQTVNDAIKYITIDNNTDINNIDITIDSTLLGNYKNNKCIQRMCINKIKRILRETYTIDNNNDSLNNIINDYYNQYDNNYNDNYNEYDNYNNTE